MAGTKIVGKHIWTDDKVRVIGSKYDGLEGVVTKLEPSRGPARYVWIRSTSDRPSAFGTKVSVTFVFIIEKTKRDYHDRYRYKDRDRKRGKKSS